MAGDSDSDSDSDRGAKKRTIAVEVSPRKPVQIQDRAFGEDSPVTVVFMEEVPYGERLIMQHVVLSARIAAKFDAVTSCSVSVTGLDAGGNTVTKGTPLNVNRQREPNLDELNAGGPITMYAEALETVLGQCSAVMGTNCQDEPGDPPGSCIGKPANVQLFTGSLAGYLVNVKRKRH